MDKITFNKIKNGNIFSTDYENLERNNEISFDKDIAVLYGPNGTGKTSLLKVLSGEDGTSLNFDYNEQEYENGQEVFMIIHDQNDRNIISGEAKDFLLGDNIKREFELKDRIKETRGALVKSIIDDLKTNYQITAKSSPIISCISDENLKKLVQDLANNKKKDDGYLTGNLIDLIKYATSENLIECDEARMRYFVVDYSAKNSLLRQIEALCNGDIPATEGIQEIEENSEAIKILQRFHDSDHCIVCDNEDVDFDALLQSKSSNRKRIIDSLNSETKKIIEQIIETTPGNDPFNIKDILMEALKNGDKAPITTLIGEVNTYKHSVDYNIVQSLKTKLAESGIEDLNTEYEEIIASGINISDEDILYIQDFINESMDKELRIERDEDSKNLLIKLSNEEFLGKDRKELPLSTGEQNFLSLCFEFLKAKNSQQPIVVIDDPISSFDSIYKNKVAYAIVRILSEKRRIILTHNVDLIRLLNAQYNGCFKLYLLNNIHDGENGFIKVSNKETGLLINLEKLLNTFRKDIFQEIKNVELFLISMIPFMRGYSSIINDEDVKEQLTQVMHGYKNEQVDIARIYTTLLGNQDNVIPESYSISVDNILNYGTERVEIVNNENYPLLNRTLWHSYIYLYLRLLVEKQLVAKYDIDTTNKKQLGQIISAAFADSSSESTKARVKLNSKKTLINEFNHFEGNLSIFQPAMDITDDALEREKQDIIEFISDLA